MWTKLEFKFQLKINLFLSIKEISIFRNTTIVEGGHSFVIKKSNMKDQYRGIFGLNIFT